MPTLDEWISQAEGLQAQAFVAGEQQQQGDPLAQMDAQAPVPFVDQEGMPSTVEGQAPVPEAQGQAPAEPSGDPLDAFISRTSQLMQEDGRIVPVDTGDKKKNAALNFFAAFNDRVAKALGAPTEIANEVLGLIGMGMFKPGQLTAENKRMFNSIGIDTEAVDGLSKDLGQAAFTSLAGFGAMMAAAPVMAAQTGTSAGALISKALGEALVKHPWLAGAEEVGATVGGVLGERAGKDNPILGAAIGGLAGMGIGASVPQGFMRRTLGAMAGLGAGAYVGVNAPQEVSTLGGAVLGSTAVGGTVGRVQGAANRIASIWRQDNNLPASAVRDPNTMKDLLPQYADDQIEGDIAVLQRSLEDAILNVPRTGSAREAQEVLRGNLEYTRKLWKETESKLWDNVPLKERVPTGQMVKDAENMKARLQEENPFGENVPTKDIDDVIAITGRYRDPETGQGVSDLPTVEQLRNLSRRFKTKSDELRAGDAPDQQKIGYYNELASIVDNTIARAFPDDVSIRQAREFSIRYNDFFRRGPIGDILSKAKGRRDIVPEGLTAEELMKSYDGLADVQRASRELLAYRIGRGSPLTREDKAFLRGVEPQVEQSIRNMFREAATDEHGVVNEVLAARWLNKHRDGIKPFARVASELQTTVDVTRALRQEIDDIGKSALAKIAQMDPDRAISSIFTSKNPTAMVRELRGALSSEPRALEALQAGVIDELFRRSGGDVTRMTELMGNPSIRRMVETAVDPAALRRLDRIIDISRKFATGDEKTLRQVSAPGVSFLARILGAHLGRKIAPGQLQAPSIMSQNFLRWSEGAMAATDPSLLMRMAVMDPKWEKILLQRIPTNNQELRQLAKRIGIYSGTLQSLAGPTDERSRRSD